MQPLEILGLVAGLCTASSVVPQLVKSIKTHRAGDVSFFMFVVLMAGNVLWIYYGVKKSDIAIITTNALSVSLNIAMLVLKIRYGGKKPVSQS